MRIHLLLPVLAFAFAQPAAALTPGICEDAATTVALMQCRGNQMAEADAKLQEYLAAAKKRATAFELESAAIDVEQAAWEIYRTKHCGNVNDLWKQGSIRYEMFDICYLNVTNERTVDVWWAYLTQYGPASSVLPDPTHH